MVVLHGLKACDTCRKARAALTANGAEVRLRDLRADPPKLGEVTDWFEAFGGALLNRRSATWRNLSEEARAGDPVALMLAHPTLVKRPVVETADGLHLGWTAETRAALGL